MAPVLSALSSALGLTSAAPLVVPSVIERNVNVERTSSTGQAYLFTFGDSYSTVGYNASGNDQPSTTNPLGIPVGQGFTTAGTGKTNWIQKLTIDHKPESLETFTYDYAVGGALINLSRYPSFPEQVTDFIGQTKNFLSAGTAPAFSYDEAVAIAYWGTNDLVAHSLTLLGNTDNSVITATMDDYWTQMEYLHNAGLRYYIVMLADPVERTPIALDPSSPANFAKTLLSNRAEWNNQLLQRVETFRSAHPDSLMTTINTDPIFNDILDYPTAYGSPNNTCHNLDGVSCLWWDDLHPGQAIHTNIANNVATTLQQMGFYPTA